MESKARNHKVFQIHQNLLKQRRETILNKKRELKGMGQKTMLRFVGKVT